MSSILSASNCFQNLVEVLIPYIEREKPNLYINIRICSNCHQCHDWPHNPNLLKIVLRLQNAHHSDIKLSLLLHYLSLRAQQSSGQLDWYVHNYWIIVPLLGRRWVQSFIRCKELDTPWLRTFLVLNWWLCAVFAGDGMTPVWWRCTCSNTEAACVFSICYADKYVHLFVHSVLWVIVNITLSLVLKLLLN